MTPSAAPRQHSERSGEVFVPEEARGRTLYFDWLELQAGRFDAHPLRIERLTVPGQFAFAHRRWMLLRSSDAIIAVVDSTPAGLLVQAHKQDLPAAAPPSEVRSRLGLPESVPIVARLVEHQRALG